MNTRLPSVLLTVACLAGLLWMTAPRRADAQGQFGQITGLVMDSSKSSIPGATIVVTNEETGVSSQTVSTGDGNYAVPLPGRYRVAGSKNGFEPVTQTGIVSQQVEVQASAATALQTESAEIGNVVPEAGVVNLPLNGLASCRIQPFSGGSMCRRFQSPPTIPTAMPAGISLPGGG